MRTIITLLFLISFITIPIVAQNPPSKKSKTESIKLVNDDSLYMRENFLIDINNFLLPMDNRGILADERVLFPDGSMNSQGRYDGKNVLYCSGIYLSGFYNNELWANAMMTSDRTEDYVAGKVGSDPEDSLNMIYILRSKDSPFGESWQNWKIPVTQGARFYDGNNDGNYDPVDLNGNGEWDINEDRPDLRGDLTAWCVFNDGVPAQNRYFPDAAPPMGIEVKQTVFAYSSDSYTDLGNVIFVSYNILNTGTVADQLDSVYFSAAVDPDIGDYVNDYAGSDPGINSVYSYDIAEDDSFSNSPALFINILEGPGVYIPGETFIDNNSNGIYDDGIDTPISTAVSQNGKYFERDEFPGARNLILESGHSALKSHPTFKNPDNKNQLRNIQIGGHLPDGTPIDPCNFDYGNVYAIDCNDVDPKYIFSGDPVNQYGWLCETQWDQRIYANTGPFTLNAGEPVDILVAYSVGRGNTSLESINVTKEIVKDVISFYETNFNFVPVGIIEETNKIFPSQFSLSQNYPNPFNPNTTIKYSIPNVETTRRVVFTKLTVFDILGHEVVTLVNKNQTPGNYEVEFNSLSAVGGQGLSSGIYFYTLKAGNYLKTKKMVLLK